MTIDPHRLGTLTLRSTDGATAELDASLIPPGTIAILQAREPATAEALALARRQVRDILGDEAAGRVLILDCWWRIWPVTVTEPEADHEELARTPSARRGEILTRALTAAVREGDVSLDEAREVAGLPLPAEQPEADRA